MKTSRTLPVLAGLFLLLVSTAIPLRGVIVSSWTGASTTDGSVLDNTNWDIGLTGNDNVSFGDTSNLTTVLLPSTGTLNNITFTGSERPSYNFHASSGTALLNVNGNLNVGSGSDILFGSDVSIALSGATHEVDVASGTSVVIDGIISGTGAIHKTGPGTLELGGANTFTGSLDLAGGWLLLGNNTAAGTNTLLLSSGTLAPTADIVLANAVTMNGSIKLGDCDTTHSITFNGAISSTGAFDTHGSGDITFAGNNSSWSGGLSLYGANNVFVNHANGIGSGSGSVWFDSASTSALHFNESSTISKLEGGSWEYDSEHSVYTGSAVILAASKTLTIDQSSDSIYSGKIAGSSDGGLSKLGSGTLTLAGPVAIDGGIDVTAGTLAVNGASESAFSSGAINVGSGATLSLTNYPWLNSTASIASGGKLTGNGHIDNATIQAGGILSPGTAACPIGELTFEDLTLVGQSTIVIGVKSDGSGNLDNSTIVVQNTETLTLSGIDPTHKLSLKLISDGLLGGLVENQPYTVSFLYFQNQAGGVLDNTNVDFSLSALDTGFANVTYSIALVGNDYVVTFTPVPEPSTYALMALGLAGTGLAAWRKRRRA